MVEEWDVPGWWRLWFTLSEAWWRQVCCDSDDTCLGHYVFFQQKTESVMNVALDEGGSGTSPWPWRDERCVV